MNADINCADCGMPSDNCSCSILPEIDAALGDLALQSELAWQAMQKANTPERFLRMGSIPVRVERDGARVVLQRFNTGRLNHELARVARWTRRSKHGEVTTTRPPRDVPADMLAYVEPPLPLVTRVVQTPIFAPGGSLVRPVAGYDSESKVYYAPTPGLVVPSIPERPTTREVAAAIDLLTNELLADFPFVGSADRTHAVALLLLPFVRDLITGPTPLHLVNKPSPGTGATLLVEMLAYPSLGGPIPVMSEGRNEDEWRKRVTAKLLAAPQFILIDNLRNSVDTAALSAAITAEVWEDRILGVSEVRGVPVRCGWIATGNNVRLSNEMSRRSVLIQMDSGTERPWERESFRHPDLRRWATEHRGELVAAALTLGQAWVAAGMPRGRKVFGTFESWAEVMGGIFDVVGLEGLLSNREALYRDADFETEAWRALVLAWSDAFGESVVRVADLWPLVDDGNVLSFLGTASERGQMTSLGRMLGQRVGRIYDGWRISRASNYGHAAQWKLEEV